METATQAAPVAESLRPIALAEVVVKFLLGATYRQEGDQVFVTFENETVVMHQQDFDLVRQATMKLRTKVPRRVSPGTVIKLVGEAQSAISEEIFRPGAIRVLYYAVQSKASAFYRCLMPMYALNMSGKAVSHASRARFGREALNYDVVVMQIENSPSALEFVLALQAQGKKVVYEIDDAFDCLEPWHPQYASYGQPERQEAIRAMMAQVDAVQVSTPWLAARYSGVAKRVEVIPNIIELAAWPPADRLRRDGKWKVLWAGSPSHAGDLEVVIPALGAFAKAHPDVVIVFFGQTVKDDRIPASQVETIDFCEFEDYASRLAGIDADVAIAPLTDVPFNRGKSNLRILQYWATGYPVIASEVGPYTEIENGHNGLLCTTSDSWLANLEMTYRNDQVCKRLSAAGQESIKAYDVLRNSKRIEEFYSSLVR